MTKAARTHTSLFLLAVVLPIAPAACFSLSTCLPRTSHHTPTPVVRQPFKRLQGGHSTGLEILKNIQHKESASGVACAAGSGSTEASNLRNITMGGGCFWCTEAVFQQLEAVTKVMPGYAGGTTANPKYKQVCMGGTGHAECVQVTYDTSKVALADILDLFFAAHDPTTVNRQGADVGRHYRSIILYEDEEQKQEALKAIERANVEYKDKKMFGIIPTNSRVVTEVAPLDTFWPAEAYHKDYFLNNPNVPYCAVNIGPKLRSFKVRSKISKIGGIEGPQ